MPLKSIFDQHGKYQDSLLDAFQHHLEEIVRRAQARTIVRLQAKLSITDGAIDPSAGNLRAIRNLNDIFMEELNRAGYQRLVMAFVGEFHGTLPFLNDVIEQLGKQVGQDWSVDFSAKDKSLLAGSQATTAAALETTIENVAGAAMTRGMFSLGGLQFGDLVATLTEKLQTSISQARTIADTGMSTFYAIATERAFSQIEQDLPQQEIKYRYSGPNDKLTRPFCEHLLEVDKGYTRERIDEMSNGQLPNVFISRGGWSCRHSWVLDTRELEARMQEAA